MHRTRGKRIRPRWRAAAIAAVVGSVGLMVLLALTTSASAASVDPVVKPGNPSCTELGYDFGFKVDPPNSGTYNIDQFNTVTVTTDGPGGLGGTNFNWSSTLGIDAVIVKGGPNANLYVYDPPAESLGDTGLHSPINPQNGQPFGLSHIEFCFDYELTVSKTAETSFKRTFEWDIEKTVTPDTWNLFTGDSGTSEYTVTVTKGEGVDSDWAVEGEITIENNTGVAATIASVSDVVSNNGAATVVCPETFPFVLPAGDDLVCTYSLALPDGDDEVNTATVTTTGAVDGGTATAPVDFGDPTEVVNDTINVEDTFAGDLGEFSDSGSTSYTRTFNCDEDKGQHDNTATIVETGQSDDASVTVNCYALEVTKDATTSFNRTWEWTIDKSADQTNLTLSEGQLFTVNYEVTVDATSTDGDFAVAGNISVKNPAPIDAVINDVTDVISPDAIAATVDCGVTFPHTLAAGGTLTCSYTADLPDNTDRTNTATATLQNHDYDSQGVGTPSSTTDFSGSANVTFSDTPDDEIDECIDVSDTNVGLLGTVCAADAPKTFTYALTFGTADTDPDVVLECGENNHPNTASFLANDSGATGSDNWVVNATVACDEGCTLTPGYWKTHSNHGPAPEDLAWFNLGPAGADTTFFLSGKTYYQVLWTAPQGNAYYILAHAYIAAKLNILDGASSTGPVDAAITFAESFFSTKTPASTLTKAQRNQVIAAAGTLDQYNNGITGPGHCSE
jgi:hypothetical protein